MTPSATKVAKKIATKLLQSHGLVLLLDEALQLVQYSSNWPQFLLQEPIKGAPLSSVLGMNAAQQVAQHLGEQTQIHIQHLALATSSEQFSPCKFSHLQAHLIRQTPESCLVELLPCCSEDASDYFMATLANLPAITDAHFGSTLVTRMQAATGYHRVQLWQCVDANFAELKAEIAHEKLPSVTPQNKQLPLASWLAKDNDAGDNEFMPRCEPDFAAPLMKMETTHTSPLIDSLLRPLPKELRTFLAQQGARAAMVIPVKHGEKLCGVLLCSHATSKPAAYGWRQFAQGCAMMLGNLQCSALSQKLAEHADRLHHTEQLMSVIVNNIPAMVFVKRASDLRFESFNQAGEELIGYKAGDLLGKNDYDFFPKEQADFFTSQDRKVLSSDKPVEIAQEVITTASGEKRTLHTRKIAVRDQHGTATHLIGVSLDISARIAYEAQIENLAFFDPLTKLPNRRLMADRLLQAMTMSKRTGMQGALLMIDLDNFKTLNDSMGHEMGDLLLIEVARRLTSILREGDTVARLGGDEFLIILRGLPNNEQAIVAVKQIANKIQESLRAAYVLNAKQSDEHTHYCTSSIGITLFRGTALKVDELIKRADTAMYQAKHAGRDSFSFFDPSMQAAVMARALLEHDLRNALDEQQMLLHYQPQINSAGCVIGAEALIRWLHPSRGLVPPNEFISVAEDTGLILAIGEWVIECACQQLVEWSKDPAMAHITLAVNVSSKQFSHPHFVEDMSRMLTASQVNPARVKLELTESLLLDNTDDVIEKMTHLKNLGVKFSLDDFGTGFSSLSYLKRLPLAQLKIDQSFVQDLLSDAKDVAIAKTIISLAHNLGLEVIAEGVENAAQRDYLEELGCHHYQGYFFCKPLPLKDFVAFAMQSHRAPTYAKL